MQQDKDYANTSSYNTELYGESSTSDIYLNSHPEEEEQDNQNGTDIQHSDESMNNFNINYIDEMTAAATGALGQLSKTEEGSGRRRSSSAIKLPSLRYSFTSSSQKQINNNNSSSNDNSEDNQGGRRRGSSFTKMLWGRRSSTNANTQKKDDQINRFDDNNDNDSKEQDDETGEEEEKADAPPSATFYELNSASNQYQVPKSGLNITTTSIEKQSIPIKSHSPSSATKRNSSANTSLPMQSTSSNEFDFIPPPPETPPPENEPKPKRPSLVAMFSSPFTNSSSTASKRNSTTATNLQTKKLEQTKKQSLTADMIPPPPSSDYDDQHLPRVEETKQKMPSSIPKQSPTAATVTKPPSAVTKPASNTQLNANAKSQSNVAEKDFAKKVPPPPPPRDTKPGNIVTSPIKVTKKVPENPVRSNNNISNQHASIDLDSIPPPPPSDNEETNVSAPKVISNPKEIIKQQVQSVPNVASIRRSSRAVPSAQISSAVQTNQASGTRRPTLLDLQSKLAEVREELAAPRSLDPPVEEPNEIQQPTISPTILNPKAPSTSTLTNGRPASLSRGASSNFARPASESISSQISDPFEDGCDENDYVRCASFLAPPAFQERSFTASIEPNQVAALIENSLTSTISLKRASGFRPQVGDVIVASPPRCGQTPILQILDTLLLQDNVDNISTIQQAEQARMPTTPEEVNNILDLSLVGAVDSSLLPLPFRAPWLESSLFDGCGVEAFAQKKDGRRVFKTHMGCSTLRTSIKPGIKYIVVARDPIDVRLSFYRFIRKLYRKSEAEEIRPFDDEYTLDSFARVPVTACRINRGAISATTDTVTVTKSHIKGIAQDLDMDDVGYEADIATWARTKEQFPQSVMIVFYEELCSQPMKTVAKIAEFMEITGKAPIPRKRIEAAVKRLMKSPLFPAKIVTKCLALATTKKTKVQLRIEELERKERAILGVRKIEQEEEPDPLARQHRRNVSSQKFDINALSDESANSNRTLLSASTGSTNVSGRSRAESEGRHARSRSRGGSVIADSVAGRARGSSIISSGESKWSLGCMQLGYRLFDDLDIEWMDDLWEMQVRSRIPPAISYEHLYLKYLGQNFPFGHRERPKHVLMERAKSQQIFEQKSKGVVNRVTSLFVGGS